MKVTPCDLLCLLFIYLKLCGTIDWSWWWVLAPFWGSCIVIVIANVAKDW
jgi:hypothetical protein